MTKQRMHKPFTEGTLRPVYKVVVDRPLDLPQGSIIAAANRIGKGIAVYALAGSGGIAPAGAHNDIVIEDNQIADTQDLGIWVTSTQGLVLRNNRFDRVQSKVKLEQCKNVWTDLSTDP